MSIPRRTLYEVWLMESHTGRKLGLVFSSYSRQVADKRLAKLMKHAWLHRSEVSYGLSVNS